ncbi:MAG: hypothetical protein A2527_09785 [Candidatus Lambdaproteobacteria bacterium RIFOXYD2_FULL_50_16]|uniref:Cyclic nucleotide-binding domain-containing protein n=1 Tax=Candidatus Lambdaproteobacteria bacterium RIFOXYD2_FULL_50_16 TaxID=1817772 RepID=A0A1F6G7P6_9PROT|nr:MAG: hypothetical protein A2527_09785 [Candidatus Lambdaproteobacteria bacterium RIFOXYD2_FULL_50_16]
MQLTKEIFVKLQESVEFFRSFTNGELLNLLKLAQTESFKDEEVVFREGTRGDKMYIILSGKVRISRPLGGGKEETLVVLESGACFGEMGIIDQSPRSARATATGSAVLMSIGAPVLGQANSGVAFKLYRNFSVMLAGRLRDSNAKVQDIAEKDRNSSQKIKDMLKKKMEGKDANMQGADLNYADLSGTYMNNANLAKSNLVRTTFKDTKLKGANFSNAKFAASQFANVEFEETNFAGGDFSGAVFKNCNFGNCDFKAAQFQGADLSASMKVEVAPKKDTKGAG